jgi:hypothetical protein
LKALKKFRCSRHKLHCRFKLPVNTHFSGQQHNHEHDE